MAGPLKCLASKILAVILKCRFMNVLYFYFSPTLVLKQDLAATFAKI